MPSESPAPPEYPYSRPGFIAPQETVSVDFIAKGRYDEAELLCKQALEILETSLGGEHPKMAVSLDSRASLMMAKVGKESRGTRMIVSLSSCLRLVTNQC